MIQRFQKILLPVDFTEKNQPALQVAGELAEQYGSTVSLIHVIETISLPEDDELRSFYAELEKRSRVQLDLMAQQLRQENAAVNQEVRFGHRAEEIVRFAAEQEVDLIVMSSHPIQSERTGRGWNTLSYQVSILCPCPILLVK